MQHYANPKMIATKPGKASVAKSGSDKIEPVERARPAPDVMMKDRSAPVWAGVLSSIFSLGTVVCILAVVITTVFLFQLVYEDKQTKLAPLLFLIGIAPILGIIIFGVAEAHALQGHRWLRKSLSNASMAAFAGLSALSLCLVHPMLGVPTLLACSLGWGFTRFGRRFLVREPLWDFLPAEAVSVFAGRDARGLALAGARKQDHDLIEIMLKGLAWAAYLGAFALSSWLAAGEVLAAAAVPAVALVSLLAVAAMNHHLSATQGLETLSDLQSAEVVNLHDSLLQQEDDENEPRGLRVASLNVFSPQGQALLSDISFDLEPGEVIGLNGGSNAGKSLVAQCIVDPFHQKSLLIRGAIDLDGQDFWARGTKPKTVPAVLVPPRPPVLPTSGARNVTCFGPDEDLERARRIMKNLVFASTAVDHICGIADATRLSCSERKILGLTRALVMRPRVLILDRPEDGLSDQMIGTFIARLKEERRYGLAVVVITQNRAFSEMCDRILVLHSGRIVDSGPAAEVRERTQAGWGRVVLERDPASESLLDRWLESQFRRDGDDANRRKVCTVANELLAFSCRDVGTLDLRQMMHFEFKHFEGYCVLRMADDAASVSSATLDAARREVETASDDKRLSPLAAAMQGALDLTATTKEQKRIIEVKIETYDPRKAAAAVDQVKSPSHAG